MQLAMGAEFWPPTSLRLLIAYQHPGPINKAIKITRRASTDKLKISALPRLSYIIALNTKLLNILPNFLYTATIPLVSL